MFDNSSRESLGVWFRKKRIKRSLAQLDVAHELGYSTPQMVSNFERGQCLPPSGKYKKLLKILGVSKFEFTVKYLREVEKTLLRKLK